MACGLGGSTVMTENLFEWMILLLGVGSIMIVVRDRLHPR